MTAPAHDFDADIIVVGAGPAGSCAAIAAARAGKSVILIERGPFPGAKNMYGGVVYPRILDELIPSWWETIPVQRWVVKRSTMLLSDTGALNVDFRANAWGAPPYNGATAYRPDFDNWLANHAVEAGARLVCSTTVTGLLRDSTGRIQGVGTDRPDGDLHAPIVIACDGVNSFLAKESGLFPSTSSTNDSACATTRVSTSRFSEAPAASTVADSSTPISTPSRSAWC
jgi:electron transfer flavoprotein-quinone oxidoreductase